MKATELRIGNWIKLFLGLSDNGPEYLELQINGVMVQNEEEYILLRNTWTKLENNIEPIELTEEWLLKFGFEKKTHTFIKYPLSIKCQSKYFYYVPTRLEIKYIHQLQNLYFALTNEELTIK